MSASATQGGHKNCKKTKLVSIQFLFVVKATILKQQISKLHSQILSIKDSFYIHNGAI